MLPEITLRPPCLKDAQGAWLAVRAVDAHVTVDGPLARTELTITFTNDQAHGVEGDLVFPLPPFAALEKLRVRIGARTIDAKIRPRARAQADYVRAKSAGQTAVLGESEGEDLTRFRIAPIAPGEEVVVEIAVSHGLTPTTEGHRLIVPLTYMPRHVEDEAKLKPTERAAVERPRPLTLAAKARVAIAVVHPRAVSPALSSPTHATTIEKRTGRAVVVVEGAALDRDLILDIHDRPEGADPIVWIAHDPGDGPDGLGPTTALAVVPPAFADEGPTVPRTVTFLVDRSGSMDGGPMASAIRAVRGCLRALTAEDHFNVIAFDDKLDALGRHPLPFNDKTLKAADDFASALTARGGTSASMAMGAALEDVQQTATVMIAERLTEGAKAAALRLRVVVFMTDGDVAGAEGVLMAAKEKLVDTRIHVVGIGDSVQHSMLAVLAREGGGVYLPVSTNEDLERALAKLKNATLAPLWTGIRVSLEHDGERSGPKRLEPTGPLDLFAGEPLLFAFRGPIAKEDHVHLTGQRRGGEDFTLKIPLAAATDTERDPAAARTIWALLRNRRMTYAFDPADDVALEDLGTKFGIVNRAVALVGIDEEQRNVAIEGSVPVVLPSPQNIHHASLTQSGSAPKGKMMSMGAPTRSMHVGGAPMPMPVAPPSPAPAAYVPSPAAYAPRGGGGAPPPPPLPSPSAPMAFSPAPEADKAEEDLAGMLSLTQTGSVAKRSPRQTPTPPTTRVRANITGDEAGLRAAILLQRADGTFDGDLGLTLAAVAALVSRGHTARAGMFMAELKRTLATLKSRVASLAGQDRARAAIAISLLTLTPSPELDADQAAALTGLSLTELPTLLRAIRTVVSRAPALLGEHYFAEQLAQAFKLS